MTPEDGGEDPVETSAAHDAPATWPSSPTGGGSRSSSSTSRMGGEGREGTVALMVKKHSTSYSQVPQKLRPAATPGGQDLTSTLKSLGMTSPV